MFEAALNIHDPSDKRSHSVLRFFSEDLTEDKKIEFVKSIFNRGSWTLATEITRTSHSIKLSEETKNIFAQILEKWVLERVNHSNTKLSKETKNPHVPKIYSYEFREAIIAIKDLGFHIELMLIIEKFLNECYKTYLDKFIDRAFWLVIDEFSTSELETFFLYFSNLYMKNVSDNIGNFLYVFLRNLAYSPKIFFLSEDFLENLEQLSQKIQKSGTDSNYSFLISILIIEFIRFKELDLSKTEYEKVILSTINKLESGKLENLELLSFLKKFNYKFEEYNFKHEINSLLNSIEVNIKKLQEADEIIKKAILHHFIKSSNEYLELLVFQLEFLNEHEKTTELKRFINLIDSLRFNLKGFMWFKEYNNFTPIKGEIVSALINGFGVELNPCYINEFISEQNYEDLKKSELIKDNLFGFTNKKSFKKNSDSNVYHSFLKKNPVKENYKKSGLDSVSETNLFLISELNYSSSNKGSVINLIPYNESIYNLLNSFKINSFFSCIDLFLANEAFNLLKVFSPFRKRQYIPVFSRLLPSTLSTPIKLDFKEDKFWNILKDLRPIIFNETYVKTKDKEKEFEELIDIYNQGKIIEGTIQSMTQGGFFVDIQGHKAFLPGSQIENYSIPDYESYIDKTMDFKIVKIDHQYKSAVVSHRIIIEEQNEKNKSSLIKKLEKGLVLQGIVKNITSYGVFIDLGGIDGLIHITDLSWVRINHPNEIVRLDQKLNLVVLDFDDNKSRIQLGLKQLSQHPWETLDNNIKVGDKVKGKVVVIADYGAFIEIEKGVEGLIHVSEMSWLTHSISANDFVNLGDEIEAKILTIDRRNQKLSLSIRQLEQDPWNTIHSKIDKGKTIKGKISKLISVGAVIEILPGIEGFAHKSNIPNNLISSLEIGKEILSKVIFIDSSKRKLSLSLNLATKKEINYKFKQKNKTPNLDFLKKIKVGDIFEGIVLKTNNGTGIIKIEGNSNLAVICPSRHMKKRDGNPVKKKDIVKFKLLEIDSSKSRLIVSHTKTYSS
ncbi:S1 RNA-binding domain-containing protein [Cellulophaga sp. 3_MG-2023]|uniref:S1 RNA-binding domain-containing protein n=1 Tax=Cellulophaga sp. 3_MG-2023 TaxID=3062675 RepID=UPI0026E22389|nr:MULTISPECIES: S1 RNA-binding domain-containing protein [unclassified Cellulophaga]MDO6492561.1 S1 RNA-binding domain-containing protein [Cellulophaga sp. 2_MG-2023]MDO6493663.1 S1 RNA-binding domain-containing protein [Cellulophaga sp. 3_MG-2023]